MPSREADSLSTKQSTVVEAFASGVSDSISSPITGAAELFGGPRKNIRQHDEANSTAHTAGEMLGSALVFVATTAAVRRFLPGAGKLAPVLAGGALGGMMETPNNTLGERLQQAALGAGTVSVLEFAPGGLARLGLKNSLMQIGASGAGAGMLHAQGDSFLRTGEAASLSDTLMAGSTWAGTGLAFTGAGKLLSLRGGTTRDTADIDARKAAAQLRAQEKYGSHFTDLPGLPVGMIPKPNSTINLATNSELAQTYRTVNESIGRAEVLAYNNGGLEGRFGTVFSVTNDGKLLTANHVVKGSIDTTVYDSQMRPHAATVVSANEAMDIALLQLKDTHSFTAFKPLALGTGTTDGVHAAFGHPNGWRELFVAPGTPELSARPNITQKYQMTGVEGMSGSPIVADGAVQAVYIQGGRANMFEVNGTPIKHAQRLLEQAGHEAPAMNDSFFHKPKLNLQLIRSFKIHDSGAATANLEKLFGKNFATERPAEFFHSKVKTVDTESGALTMKMQYEPVDRKIVISPIAIEGKPIPEDMTWAHSRLNINKARLELRMDADGKPLTMVSYDDPILTLQQGFNYRGENNYLATLKQYNIPRWMQLLPPQFRFERLARRS